MAKVHTCGYCDARLIIARGVPPLNAGPDPLGTVAARQAVSGAWLARFLAKGEEPAAALTEHRYSVHECDGLTHALQRAQVKTAIADLRKQQRRRRGRRPAPQVTGYVVQPPQLPLGLQTETTRRRT